ncbi:HesB/IscA family protein [Blattabacterium cuenoti]|uniref:HesB/IscA family protein n=1 Tax=Blattabacterium cuenoti TaxID=1653831 RepID=UPI00163B6306|nr:iron-sulfur cluster assembly accessory protein [Blattabacterium cuenoti]
MVFVISEKAKNKLIHLMKKEGFSHDESFVRFGVKTGCCSSLSYELTFDQKKQKGDQLFHQKEMKILIDQNSIPYLEGTTLEYSDELNGKGFYFKKPKTKDTCRCGKSFSS